jgi:hypothetical protein
MFTFNSCKTREGLDLTIAEEILLMRSSRTATFTLSSSSFSSSSCSNLYNHQSGRTTTTTMCSSSSNSYVSEHRPFIHSQSLILNNQRRRPTIHDPYQLAPNLQILNDWMIVSFCFFVAIDLRNYPFYNKSQLKFQTILLMIIICDEKKNHRTIYFIRNEINDGGDK